MADGPFSGVRPFDKDEQLKVIREKILNPLARQVVETIDPKVKEIEPIAKNAYKEVTLDAGNKRLKFKRNDSAGDTEINLSPIIPDEFQGMSVTSGSTTVNGIKRLNLKNGILVGAGDLATVDYDWDNLVPAHQERVMFNSGKPGDGDVILKTLKFGGNTDKISVSGNEITLTVPNDPTEFTAQIGTGTQVKPIKQIKLVGNTTGSEIDSNGVLSIQVPDDGTGGGTLIGNFKGFYENLGALEADPNLNPLNGKSYAFVRDDKLKDQYYTPYMYVNNKWTEAPIDPAITYEDPSQAPIQGVRSFKPDTRLKIDKNGQLDLSGLYGEGHFQGFFDSKADLMTACPNPVVDRSFGYVKTATGSYTLMGYKRANGEGTIDWRAMAPYGVISAFTKSSGGDVTVSESIHGIVKNGMVTIDSGKVTIKDVSAEPKTITVKAIDRANPGVEQEKDVTRLHFVDGIYVDLSSEPNTARIHHPQKVIHYDGTYESQHNTSNYLGHIFYDDNSNTWVGYSEGNEGTSVTPKWTRIAHRGMSDEVKGINSRLPIVTEEVTPGPYGDNRQWEHCGWSYVDSAYDVGVEPESTYKTKGMYIQTYARKGASDLPSARPSKRLQVGFIDDASGEVFTRIQDDAAGDTNPFYKPWSKVSMSQKDIENHNSDPNAHKDNNKYYKVLTANMTYKAIKDAGYNIYDNRCMLITDSHGLSKATDQYSKIPYTGQYKISGRINFDGTKVSGQTFQGQWILRIVRRQGSAESIVASFAYNHQSSTDDTPALIFHAKDLNFNAGDTVKFYLQCLNDSQMGTNFPNVKFIPMRTYFVIEDNSTDAGSLIAETQRILLGPLYARDDVSIHAHRSGGSSTGALRLYAGQIQMNQVEMTKAT